MRPIHIWYFPSNYGDIRLEAKGDSTRVIWFKLTYQEAIAMKALRKASTHGIRKWATKKAWSELGEKVFDTGVLSEVRIDLKAPLPKVAKILTKTLRPDRETVHVMRIGQGKIEEIRSEDFDDVAPALQPANDSPDPEGDVTPFRKEAKKTEETALAKTGTDDAPVKVVTVKKPVRGCPAPDFEQVTHRATRVLQAFLTPEQIEDFNRHQRFVSLGADTGHPYMLTSRNAPSELEMYGSRCVFDLETGTPFCVHDWDVPAEEELLALHSMLSIPGYESWARGMPDNGYQDPPFLPPPVGPH